METKTSRSTRRSTEMFALVESYEHSGMSQQDFCAHHGLKLSTFGYWRTKYLAKENPPEGGFVSLIPEGSMAGEIHLRYGAVELSFTSSVSVEFLVSLVQKLRI